MYITSFIPTSENHSIEIPKEFFGQKVSVEVKKTIPIISKEERIRKIRSVFDGVRINLSNFKFDRDEANDYDK